ncbi:hypothetical protein ACUN9Z_18365, partial [Escherichia sp. HC-CC4]
VIPETGGLRKVRWVSGGKGKRAGVRIQGQEKLKTTEFIVGQQFLNIFSKNFRFDEEHNYTPLA